MEAASQSDEDQLRRQSLQCSWTSNLKLSANGPQTAELVMQLYQKVAEARFIWSMGTKRTVISLLNCALEILVLTYLVYCLHDDDDDD